MSGKIPELYVVTARRRIAHAQLQLIERTGHVYLYLQWKDARKPERRYLGRVEPSKLLRFSRS